MKRGVAFARCVPVRTSDRDRRPTLADSISRNIIERLVHVAGPLAHHLQHAFTDPAVVIPLSTQHYPMLQRNLVYTGVTRGKRLVVLVGQRKALAIAVKGSRA